MQYLAQLIEDTVPAGHHQVFIRGDSYGRHTPIEGVAPLYGSRFNLGFVTREHALNNPKWHVGCRLIAAIMHHDTFHSLPDYALPATVPVLCEDPRLIFAYAGQPFLQERVDAVSWVRAISGLAEIDKSVIIGPNVCIGPDVSIGPNTLVGPGAVINHAVIGEGAHIGANVVLGSPGFGFVKDNKANVVVTFPHVGRVIIEDGVTIMAGTCVCRGSLADTVIRRNAKIDQLCHIAHNCYIGENAFVIANTMLGGSTTIHDDAWVAPSTSTIQGTEIGHRGMTGVGAVVIRHVGDETVHVGNPAKFLRNRKEGE